MLFSYKFMPKRILPVATRVTLLGTVHNPRYLVFLERKEILHVRDLATNDKVDEVALGVEHHGIYEMPPTGDCATFCGMADGWICTWTVDEMTGKIARKRLRKIWAPHLESAELLSVTETYAIVAVEQYSSMYMNKYSLNLGGGDGKETSDDDSLADPETSIRLDRKHRDHDRLYGALLPQQDVWCFAGTDFDGIFVYLDKEPTTSPTFANC
jgi:hypothetical protein